MFGIRVLAAAGVVITALQGCASTTVRAARDPGYEGKQYKQLMVFANISDFELRGAAEEAYALSLHNSGYLGKVYMSHKYFPPTREYGQGDFIEVYRKLKADSLLEIRSTSSGTTTAYIPRSTTTRTQGEVKESIRGVKYGETSTTAESGGYSISKPWMKFEVRLFDVATMEPAWIAFTTTNGNAYADFQTIIWSQAESVAAQMVEQRIVASIE